MPRYFFHVFAVDWYRDEEGEELSDFGSAILEAKRLARELAEDKERGVDDCDSRVDIADAAGRVLHVVRFREASGH